MCTVHKHLTIPHLYAEYSKICNAYITNDFFRIFQVGTAVANINKLHKKEMVSSFLYLSPFIDGGRNRDIPAPIYKLISHSCTFNQAPDYVYPIL